MTEVLLRLSPRMQQQVTAAAVQSVVVAVDPSGVDTRPRRLTLQEIDRLTSAYKDELTRRVGPRGATA